MGDGVGLGSELSDGVLEGSADGLEDSASGSGLSLVHADTPSANRPATAAAAKRVLRGCLDMTV
ncbi:hypothetical protein GCM10027402_00030 [Arthrobacter monumenti]